MKLSRLVPRVVNLDEDKGFNGRIIDCIDKALDTFGPGTKATIYYQLREIHGLTSLDFQSKPNVMIDHLREILGVAGSSLIEKLIVKEIKASFDLKMNDSTSLAEAIDKARKKFFE